MVENNTVEELRSYFHGEVGDDHGRKYTVTDGVLYEDEFPLAFSLITGKDYINSEPPRWTKDYHEDTSTTTSVSTAGKGLVVLGRTVLDLDDEGNIVSVTDTKGNTWFRQPHHEGGE